MGRSLLLACALMLSGCVERMFFYPDRVQYTRPADVGLAHEDVDITTADGVRLHGWWLPAQGAARGSVLHLHGNAANVSNHLPLVAWLPPAGFNVLMVDYRGFGASQGTPTPDSVVEDALAALRYLRARGDTDPARLIVFGQSLGGATALRMLARDAEGVRLAIIDSAFASYRGIARDAATGSIVLAPDRGAGRASYGSADVPRRAGAGHGCHARGVALTGERWQSTIMSDTQMRHAPSAPLTKRH